MEVVLTDGSWVDLSIKAMRMYLERVGIDGYLYAWPEDELGGDGRTCVRIDDTSSFPEDYEPFYSVVLGDLGKVADIAAVRGNLVGKEYNLFTHTDKVLIGVLRELKDEASLRSRFFIATIPDDIEWHIEEDPEYGSEWVQEGSAHPQRWYGQPIGGDYGNDD